MSFKVPSRRLKSGLHKCVCGETYSRRDYLFRHMKFSCDMVRSKLRKFPDDDGSANPFGASFEKKFQCDCGLKYYHPHNLVRHQKTSCKLLKGGKVRQDVAGTSAEKPHSREMDISFTCDCGQTFQSRETFKIHRNTNCPRLVGKTASKSLTVAGGTTKVVHTRKWGTVTGPPWVCDCGKASKTIWGYYRHRQHGDCSGASEASMVQSDGEGAKPIASTSQQYVPYDALTPEISLQLVEPSDESGYQAYDQLEVNEQNLEDLIERQVEPSTPKFKCACGKAFANGKQLGGHSRSCRKRLLGGAAYKCYCGLKFPTKKRMIRHISQKHSNQKGETGFVNSAEMIDVPKKIKTPKALKKEEPVEKPFDCICGKSYANKFLLTRHIQNSCGLDLRCPLCGKNHPFKARLYVHMRDIHGLRPETVYPFRPQDEVTNHPSMPEM